MASAEELLRLSNVHKRAFDTSNAHRSTRDGMCASCSCERWPCTTELAAEHELSWCARRIAAINDDLKARTAETELLMRALAGA